MKVLFWKNVSASFSTVMLNNSKLCFRESQLSHCYSVLDSLYVGLYFANLNLFLSCLLSKQFVWFQRPAAPCWLGKEPIKGISWHSMRAIRQDFIQYSPFITKSLDPSNSPTHFLNPLMAPPLSWTLPCHWVPTSGLAPNWLSGAATEPASLRSPFPRT